jgi:hypothetical protein
MSTAARAAESPGLNQDGSLDSSFNVGSGTAAGNTGSNNVLFDCPFKPMTKFSWAATFTFLTA